MNHHHHRDLSMAGTPMMNADRAEHVKEAASSCPKAVNMCQLFVILDRIDTIMQV